MENHPKEKADQDQSLISAYYDGQTEREWDRTQRHRTEFALTWRALEEHLPPLPARLLDCGGGPGRYAIQLSKLGYQVTLFDLSAGNLKVARERAQQAGVEFYGLEQGSAIDLSRFPESAFDAVLLMGPLYHLLEEEDRLKALQEARRVLRPGGTLFAAFISRFAAHRREAKHNPQILLEDWETSQTILETGRIDAKHSDGAEFIAYLAHPNEIAPLIWQAGFEVQAVLGLEGLVSQNEEKINELEGLAWERWVEVNWQVASDHSLLGGQEHLLVVAQRPVWRMVLAAIAQKLEEQNISYTAVGGVSVAAQGAPIPVKDIDLELSEKDAIRFGEIFAEAELEPVTFKESQNYRSHFGRFQIDSLIVEVMGDLQRREKDGWKPSMTSTREQVLVEGVPVSVSWLEEETLAYLRRGRLDRAALCLPGCNPDRIRQLITGEVKTNVI